MIGAGALAVSTLSGVGTSVVKNEEGGPAHCRGVIVDLRVLEALFIVGERDKEFSIVRDHRTSLLSQSRCPKW